MGSILNKLTDGTHKTPKYTSDGVKFVSVKDMSNGYLSLNNTKFISKEEHKELYLRCNSEKGDLLLSKVGTTGVPAIIETDELRHYNNVEDYRENPPAFKEEKALDILKKIKASKRPVLFVGEAIRLSGSYDEFQNLVEKLKIPVVTAWNAHDAITDDNPYYCGRPGTQGTRGGNFVTQFSDLLLVLGCRLNIRQISYNWENFAKDAYKIIVDIDPAELQKPTLNIDCPVHANVKDVISVLNRMEYEPSDNSKWIEWGKNVNKKYPVCLEKYRKKESPINPYVFLNELFKQLDENDTVVTSNGSACVCSFQTAIIKKNTRLFTNSGCAAMGYGLPAALGVSVARRNEQFTRTICIEGDGSLQMNIQELQTILQNKMNIKIIVLNNSGYHSIRQTQRNLFANHCEVGVGEESGDLSFPELERISYAYRLPYKKIEKVSTIKEDIKQALDIEGPIIIEAVIDPDQFFSPKLGAKRLPDGTMVSPSLEDMSPFLPEGEVESLRKEAYSL